VRKLLSASAPGYLNKLYGVLPKLVGLFLFELKARFLAKMPSQAEEAMREKRLIHVRTPYGTIACPEDALDTVKEIYEREVYTCVRPLKHDDVVMDVGAHVGIFTLKAAREAEDGLIVAVEPDPGNFRLLVRNIRANGLENVIPV